MIKIAICDNSTMVCSDIENTCLEFSSKEEIALDIDVFHSGEMLLKEIKHGDCYDLIFLEIELGGMNGIEAGLSIRNDFNIYVTEIVYISAYVKYALELFKVQPMNFLIKPFNRHHIYEVLRQLVKQSEIAGKMFSYKIGRTEEKVLLSSILYFKSIRREIEIYTMKGECIRFYSSIKELRGQLEKLRANFIYPHKSYIVNCKWIKHFHYDFMEMENDDCIPISQNNRKEISALQRKEYENYAGESC